MIPNPAIRFVPILFVLALAGCKGGGGGVSVSGTATIDGKPLDFARIEFAPVDKESKIGSEGAMTDAQGNFTILPDKRKKGLEPGTYGVRVTKWVDKKTKKPPENLEDVEQLKLGGFLINVVPYKYSDPETNPPITVDLKWGKNDKIQIEVKTK